MATAFSVYVLLLTLLRGSARFETYGMTTWGIIATYYGAGLAVGALVGVLRPLTRWALGAVMVGAVGGICVYGAIAYAMDGRLEPDFALTVGPLVGGAAGYITWRNAR